MSKQHAWSGNRETGKTVKALLREGWTVKRGNGSHWKLRPPDGQGMVVLCSSPGRGRATANEAADIRRAKAAYEERLAHANA